MAALGSEPACGGTALSRGARWTPSQQLGGRVRSHSDGGSGESKPSKQFFVPALTSSLQGLVLRFGERPAPHHPHREAQEARLTLPPTRTRTGGPAAHAASFSVIRL